jgi:3-oxoacyl-[acyl-carrier protein] reductase
MAGALDGKVALVTGAGRNIGRAIALGLARDGAAVVVNGRSDRNAVESVAGEIAALGGRAVAHLADVSDPRAVERMVEDAAAALGGIDIAVLNAGLRRQTPFLDMRLEEWREILSVALDGAFVLTQAVVPHMIRRGGGAVVGLSGISTHVGTPQRAHVSASKAGLEGLMRALAVELAPHGIRVNAVCPGNLLDGTLWQDSLFEQYARTQGLTRDEVRAKYESQVPLGRGATNDDVANVVVFLCSDESSYMTGQAINVTGGQEMR